MFSLTVVDRYPQHRGVYERLKAILAKATRDNLNSPDWATNLSFCDYVNANKATHSCAFAVFAITKRLSTLPGHSNRVNWLSLMLLESCMKNCGRQLHEAVAESKLIKLMLKLAKGRISGKKSSMNAKDLMKDLVEERVLLLIRAWGKAFKNNEAPLDSFVECYRKLRAKGVVFPEERPEDSIGPVASPSVRKAKSGDTHKRRAQSLEDLTSNLNLLTDLIDGLPSDQNPEQDSLIVDLVSNCREQKPSLVKLIEANVDNEKAVTPLMKLFERLEMVLGEYDLRCKRPEQPKAPIRRLSVENEEESEEFISVESEDDDEQGKSSPRRLVELDKSDCTDTFIQQPAPTLLPPSNPFLVPQTTPFPTFAPPQPASWAPFNTPFMTPLQQPIYPPLPYAMPQPTTAYFDPFAPTYLPPAPTQAAPPQPSQTTGQKGLDKNDPFLSWL